MSLFSIPVLSVGLYYASFLGSPLTGSFESFLDGNQHGALLVHTRFDDFNQFSKSKGVTEIVHSHLNVNQLSICSACYLVYLMYTDAGTQIAFCSTSIDIDSGCCIIAVTVCLSIVLMYCCEF